MTTDTRASRIESINAMAELERVGWKFEPLSDDEIKCLCPVHEDHSPSLCLNVKKNLWKCHVSSCHASGDIVSLLAFIMKVERSTMLVDLSTRYDLGSLKTINPSVVEKFHEAIGSAGPLLTALRERGITDEMIRAARIGFHAGRITIPVYDLHGHIVNVRRYLPGAPGHLKMQNTRGYGAAVIYQVDQLTKFKKVWICGGEMKALVAKTMLNPEGIGAVSVTSGEGVWDPKWNALLKDKDVWICMDIDLAGRTAARKLGNLIFRAANSVRIIHLPMDKEKHKKGDINDWVAKEGATVRDMIQAMQDAVEYRPNAGSVGVPVAEQEIFETTLSRATNPANIGRRISFEGVVTAMDTIPYLVPCNIRVMCDRAQPVCGSCPIMSTEPDPDSGGVTCVIPSTSSGLLDAINAPASRLTDAIRTSLGIPKCRSAQFVTLSHYQVRDVRIAPQLSIASEGSENIVQPALMFTEDAELNTPYLMAGVVWPHPRNQQAVLMLDEAEEVEDNLSSFDPSEEQLKDLRIFSPKDWSAEGIKEHLGHLYSDLEANVTRIFGRRDLHVLVDLTYHSILTFEYDGKNVPGWVNSLVLGDSSQGKSETTTQLQKFYGLGERVELKNASVAGLIGGLQQLGTRWFVSWGVIPTHDRRLVILEEAKGAPIEMIGKLTDMRSSGIAEIPKIERRRAHARTRLLFLSNPRSGRPMSAFNFGVEAVQELIGSLEDVRRFDIALIVSSSDVDPGEVNKRLISRPKVTPRFPAEICRRLILFAWTRRPEHVVFEQETLAFIAEASVRLCSKFTETLPLVDRGTIRYKIARLAAALAARTFSVDPDNETLRVRPGHAEFVVRFMEGLYSKPTFGYADFSRALERANNVVDPQEVEKRIAGSRHPADAIAQMLYRDQISVDDIQDWFEVDEDIARGLLSFLVRKHCLYREQRWYTKTPAFILLLKDLAPRVKTIAIVGEGEEF